MHSNFSPSFEMHRMPLVIELRIANKVVDDVETSWHAMEAALIDRREQYPLVDRIVPYDYVTYERADIVKFSKEIRRLSDDPRGAPIKLLQDILRLCELAIANPHAD